MGHSVKRKEDLRFILGKGTYVDDVHLPGMVYGHMVRSPYAHAKIIGIRSEEAKKLPGVLAVITGQDLERQDWPGCQPYSTTGRWSWRPERCCFSLKRSRSWLLKIDTPRPTPLS